MKLLILEHIAAVGIGKIAQNTRTAQALSIFIIHFVGSIVPTTRIEHQGIAVVETTKLEIFFGVEEDGIA